MVSLVESADKPREAVLNIFSVGDKVNLKTIGISVEVIRDRQIQMFESTLVV